MAAEVIDVGASPEIKQREWKKWLAPIYRVAAYAGVFAGLVFLGSHMEQHNFQFSRPARATTTENLYQGITHTQEARDIPRKLMVHTLQIDVSQVNILVSPPVPGAATDSIANTATNFLKEHDLQLVVNANFFKDFKPGPTPFLTFPKIGSQVDAQGLVISRGIVVSESQKGYPALCFINGRAEIRNICPKGTENAVAGNKELVKKGRVNPKLDSVILHPRVAAGVSADGKTIWLVVIDGRQPGYSEGMTLAELAQLMWEHGAVDAINLDGGGSATAVSGKGRINSPVQNTIWRQERPDSTFLGFEAQE